MSKERDRSRDGRTGAKTAAKPDASTGVHEHQERVLSLKAGDETTGPGDAITQSPRRSGTKHVPKAAAKSPGKTAKAAAPASATTKPRPNPNKPAKQAAGTRPAAKRSGRTRTGRPDGPLARRRRRRIRVLVALLLVVNIAVGAIWRDWSVSLAVLILTVITAPLLAALLLRRKR